MILLRRSSEFTSVVVTGADVETTSSQVTKKVSDRSNRFHEFTQFFKTPERPVRLHLCFLVPTRVTFWGV